MQFDMKGRAALITGSTRGIGAAIAEAYCEAGADVVIHGRSSDSLHDDLLERCRRRGVRAEFVAVDLAGPVPQVVESLFTKAVELCPHIDILINNAGGHQGEGDFLHVQHEVFERSLRLHATVPFFLTQRFARHWIAQGIHGHMLAIGSINGVMAESQSSAYDTSKGAQAMMVRTLAVELARHNIRVNGIAPGLVVTDRTQWVVHQPDRGDWVRLHTPNSLVPDAHACVGAAVFLVSPAAYHIHGQMLMIDGGMSIWQMPDMPSPS